MGSENDLTGEVVALHAKEAIILPEGPMDGLSIGTQGRADFRAFACAFDLMDRANHRPAQWPPDGRPLLAGGEERGFDHRLRFAGRNRLGARSNTGL